MSDYNFSTRSIESRRQNNFSRNHQRHGHSSGFGFGKIIIIALILWLVYAYFEVKSTANVIIPAKNFTISNGDNIFSLNKSLQFGLAEWRYRWYIRLFAPLTDTIKTGSYETTENMPLSQFLTEGFKKKSTPSNEITIKLLPGWNIYDYDAYFAKNDILPAWDFIKTAEENFAKYQAKYSFLAWAKSLEGFLMPDTYRIFKNSSADNIIVKLLETFESRIAEDYATMDAKTAYETLILASIVEREEKNSQNRPIVAGILAKRVREGIAMGADATVCYGFKKTFDECTPSFIGSVINDHSNPYNTRKTLGYPPTPISSVSVSAWNAAFKPEKSNYYYYLHDNSGTIRYATTLSEHNANVQKYLR